MTAPSPRRLLPLRRRRRLIRRLAIDGVFAMCAERRVLLEVSEPDEDAKQERKAHSRDEGHDVLRYFLAGLALRDAADGAPGEGLREDAGCERSSEGGAGKGPRLGDGTDRAKAGAEQHFVGC